MKDQLRARSIRLAILASSNMDLLERPLVTQLAERGFCPEAWNPGFNQYRQAILDPSSELYKRNTEGVILFLDAGDLFANYLASPYDHCMEEVPAVAKSASDEVFGLVQAISSRLPGATVFLNTLTCDLSGTYHGMEYNSTFSFRQIVSAYNANLYEVTRISSNVLVVDVEMLAASAGLELWFDSRLWYLGRIRYSLQAHRMLASEYAMFIAARWGDIRKCIVLDLDNTLWGGVVGEDGLTGIQLGYEGIGLAFADFQRDLLNLRKKGILLAICSKNNAEDAYEVIRGHPAMVLREEDFSVAQINWNDKVEGVREIARRLNIGVDSLVFIDDNPVERARVREAIPEVAVPEWPDDPCDYKRALCQVASDFFLKFDITDDDRRRGEMYQTQAKRERLAESAGCLEEFFWSLQMKPTIATASAETFQRISQLTQKTNQFNLTTRRYTESEIGAMSSDPGCRVYWLDLEDRFGRNGIVGVLIARARDSVRWHIDSFLLSCRVIGRTVEDAFLGLVTRDLHKAGATQITGEYIPTAKNGIAANFYDSRGFSSVDAGGERTLWELDISKKCVAVPEWFRLTDNERTMVQ